MKSHCCVKKAYAQTHLLWAKDLFPQIVLVNYLIHVLIHLHYLLAQRVFYKESLVPSHTSATRLCL